MTSVIECCLRLWTVTSWIWRILDNEDAVKTNYKGYACLLIAALFYRNNNIEEQASFYINYQTYMEPEQTRTKILLIVGASELLSQEIKGLKYLHSLMG
jgi:hypothetical protein